MMTTLRSTNQPPFSGNSPSPAARRTKSRGHLSPSSQDVETQHSSGVHCCGNSHHSTNITTCKTRLGRCRSPIWRLELPREPASGRNTNASTNRFSNTNLNKFSLPPVALIRHCTWCKLRPSKAFIRSTCRAGLHWWAQSSSWARVPR
jgi:hypothetical protein